MLEDTLKKISDEIFQKRNRLWAYQNEQYIKIVRDELFKNVALGVYSYNGKAQMITFAIYTIDKCGPGATIILAEHLKSLGLKECDFAYRNIFKLEGPLFNMYVDLTLVIDGKLQVTIRDHD